MRLHTLPEYFEGVSVGDTFEVVDETDDSYFIVVDGFMMAFTTEPDFEGLSYKTWFNLVEEG